MVSDLLSQAVGAVMLTRWLMNRFCEIKLRKKKKVNQWPFLGIVSKTTFLHFLFLFLHFFIFIFSSLTCALNIEQMSNWYFLSQ